MIGRQIRIIKIEKDNLTRLEYSIMLLNSKFYEQFWRIFINLPGRYYFI